MMLAACEGPEGPMGPAGPQGAPGQNGQNGADGRDGDDGRNGLDGSGTHWFKTDPITIRPRDWSVDGGVGNLNSFYYYKVRVPELTRHIYENGSVIAYVENLEGKKNGMPFVFHRGTVLDNGQEYTWTETYDFDFSADSWTGWITFYLTYSDFNTNIDPDEDKTFYVVAFWENE